MAGLYEGLEEVAFKRIADGYLFVSNNPWLIGPRRRYFVNEAQKALIAECIRQTLRRIKPFALASAVLIPLVLVAAVLWLACAGCTLSVTTVDAAGVSTTYTQPIGPTGATGTLAGAAGATAIFKVSGPPGKDATVTFTGVGPTGKASAPCVAQFGPAGAKINFADASGHVVGSATLIGRTGSTPGAVMLDAMLLTFGMFVPYIALMHAYSMRRLRPLIAGLPRSEERITLREGIEGFAAKASFKLLVVMGLGAAAGFVGNAMNLAAAILESRPIANPPIILLGMAATGLATTYVAYLIILRAKLKRNAN
ncbi:MAG: hypothetical protein ACHQAY_00430 [Hyphomicrobiales bacterium]